MTLRTSARYKNPDDDPAGPYVLQDVTSSFDRPNQRFLWHGRMPPEGRSWRYSQEHAKRLDSEGRIVVSPNAGLRMKRYLREAVEREREEQTFVAVPSVDFIIRRAMKLIPLAIAENPKCLRDVEWRDLERAMYEVFEQLGFGAELTRSGKDGGFDLRLEFDEAGEKQVFLIEVKHWLGSGKRPGEDVLSALVDVVVSEGNETRGVLLSTSGFTRNVLRGRTEVEQHKVKIAGEKKIVSLCQSYRESVEGVWFPTTELSELLLEGTS